MARQQGQLIVGIEVFGMLPLFLRGKASGEQALKRLNRALRKGLKTRAAAVRAGVLQDIFHRGARLARRTHIPQREQVYPFPAAAQKRTKGVKETVMQAYPVAVFSAHAEGGSKGVLTGASPY